MGSAAAYALPEPAAPPSVRRRLRPAGPLPLAPFRRGGAGVQRVAPSARAPAGEGTAREPEGLLLIARTAI